ncbi:MULTISPECIES: phosphoribosylformylglycinamidine cyclo-ligase [unclassified Ligilactobacillus]|uniref:phosphoribosylformylglycinamidine cyclo-ligase n=1 Tax=unclassified Ligilactobacillus TaxID=2767920 RepID=UPI003854807F
MNRYQEAGVDVTAGYEMVRRIQESIASTQRPGATGQVGSFGGTFDLETLHVKHPVLVAGTDGVGTKLLVAQRMHEYETIGIDCVAMCVNDIVAQGAAPLFFLDYIATGKMDPEAMAAVVKGVATGCRQAKAAIIGGETAEMPDMYPADEYDLAGFAVGVAERAELLTTDGPQEGDVLLGLRSSGLHSNGYSLVRQILFKDHHVDLQDHPAELEGLPLGNALLQPTRIYVRKVMPLVRQHLVHGMSHITGGGLIENVPRMFGDQLQAVIDETTIPVPGLIRYLIRVGKLALDDCWQTFNMGVGMVLAVAPENVVAAKQQLRLAGEEPLQIGQLRARPAQDAPQIVIQ